MLNFFKYIISGENIFYMYFVGDDVEEDEGENFFVNIINNLENEKLYIDDFKKVLKGFFEREGIIIWKKIINRLEIFNV